MAETFPEFLTRVHRDDVETGKGGMHKPGVCKVCDNYRDEREAS